MNTKLTLTIEQAVIENAKQYAKQKNRSLSDLIESYLKALTIENVEKKTNNSPIGQSLKQKAHLKCRKISITKKHLQTIFGNHHDKFLLVVSR